MGFNSGFKGLNMLMNMHTSPDWQNFCLGTLSVGKKYGRNWMEKATEE